MAKVNLSNSKVKKIKEALEDANQNVVTIMVPLAPFVKEEAFETLMGISSETAQRWREEGRIGFSQNGENIYYQLSDIHTFLEDHHRKPFNSGNSYS